MLAPSRVQKGNWRWGKNDASVRVKLKVSRKKNVVRDNVRGGSWRVARRDREHDFIPRNPIIPSNLASILCVKGLGL